MGRVSNFWKRIGDTIEPVFAGGANILIRGTNRYLNFGSEDGSDGYGFRDNAGTIEYKSSGGDWAEFGTGGGGGGGGGGITTEQAVDAVASAIASGTHTGITITYNDAGDSIDFDLSAGTTDSLALADSALQASDLVNTLTSTATNRPLTAAQGKVLKDLIDTINTLIGSDETTLDTLQEIVDFIEINRDSLDNLSIGGVAGLQTALDAKQATLVSGTNIRTVNGQSLLGSTNLVTPDTNTTYSEITTAEIDAGSASTLRTMTGRRAGYILGLVISRVLTGLSTATSTAVTAADTILVAIGKLQAQVTLKANLASPTFTGTVGGITKAMVGLGSANNTTDADKPVSTAQQTALNLKSNIRGAVNAQTGTTYTLVIGDEYLDGVRITNAAANTITIPPNSAVAFPVNTKILITQGGAGSTTIAAGAGVTINAPASAPLAIGEIHGSRVCQKTATDSWLII